MGEEEVAGAAANERAAHPPQWLRVILDGEEVANLQLSTVEERGVQVGEAVAARHRLVGLTSEAQQNNPPQEKTQMMQLAIKKKQRVCSFKLWISVLSFFSVACYLQILCWNDLGNFCWLQVEEWLVEEVTQLPWERGVQMLNKCPVKRAPKTRFGTKTLMELNGVN